MLRKVFERLDSREFESIGICFETEEETQEFGELIREKLEVRIGDKISRRSTKVTDISVETSNRLKKEIERQGARLIPEKVTTEEASRIRKSDRFYLNIVKGIKELNS